MASFAIVLRLVVCLPVLRCGIDCVATAAATVPAQETCTVSTVTEGEFAVMTFMLRSGMDTASKTFFAHLRRRDRKMTDIITCNGLKVSCNVKDGHPMFQVEGNLKENILKVRISNMSRELEDTYVLQVFFNGTAEPSSSCALTMDTRVNATLVTDAGIDDENGSYGWIAAPIVVLIAIAILFFFRKKIQHCWSRHVANTDRTPKSNERSANPLLPNTQPQPCSQANVDHPSTSKSSGVSKAIRTSKPSPTPADLPEWVFRNLNEKEAKERLLSEGKDDFTFLVRTDKKKMFISVRFDPHRVVNYQIHHDVKGYWIERPHGFVELSNLVVHYRNTTDVFGHILGNRIDAKL